MPTLIDFANTGADGAGPPLRCAFDVPRQTLVAHRPAQVRPLLDAVHALSQQGFWCVGYLRYEAAAAFDPAFEVHEADGPLAWFGVHDAPLAWPETDSAATATAQWHAGLSRSAFNQGMADIHRAIADGELYQLNYTAPLHGVLEGAPHDLFRALRRAQPGGYAAFIDTSDEQVLSVSPELFFDWDGERILVRPMKGTAPRGATPADDAALAAQLRASAKERAENVMIVDLIRNDLSRVAQPFSVRVPHLFRLEALPSVWQMTSDVEARTRPGTTLADVFAALFPCGSITGAPKVRAMRMIRALESGPRGVYCGAVGVVRPGGAATFNVPIRTVALQRGSVAPGAPAAPAWHGHFGVGSAITFYAKPLAEWRELAAKTRFLERAAQRFELLETLRLEAGHYWLLEQHLARMAGSAAYFGFEWRPDDVQACLDQLLGGREQGVYRVRLTCSSEGQAQAQAFDLQPSPQPVFFNLSAQALESMGREHEFVAHKTTRRQHYEARLRSAPGVFDTLMRNERGELTEFTRGNLALKMAGRWLTPALHCGLLAGTYRADLLARGELTEAALTLADLQRAEEVAFFNSVRGWLVARLVA